MYLEIVVDNEIIPMKQGTVTRRPCITINFKTSWMLAFFVVNEQNLGSSAEFSAMQIWINLAETCDRLKSGPSSQLRVYTSEKPLAS